MNFCESSAFFENMKLILIISIISAISAMHTRPITTLNRPRCVCSGRITAIMHDINGGYCIYYGENGNRRWKCENTEEWDRYLNTIQTIAEEPTCHCSGIVTGIMEDETGTYCVYNGLDRRTRWECENKEEWDLYKRYKY
ncbi:hypothetical protein RN001_014343 [Aquatica leii]|uniref:Uncharacterized protein n=1 Tax=Aquatica leii TaxID=1421715 RepID=A0AAN7QDU5_9COLE|nr:hypothetical protein RN001_014343 [Aquatica leii]